MIGEPTMMRPRHSHMGKLAFEIVCTAAAAHSSLSHSKPSAIAAAARLHQRARGPAEPVPPDRRAGGDVQLRHDHRRHRHSTSSPSDARSRSRSATPSITIPTSCSRRSWMRGGGRASCCSPSTAGRSTSPRSPAIRRCAPPSDDPWLQVVERIADAGPATSIGFGTEGGLFAEALDASVVICGPGDIAVAHRPDEYVTVDQLLRCERFLCGARPADVCRSCG